MKAISLWQPWASAIAVGLKQNETRHWPTPYRGPLAIHAAQKHDRSLARFFASMMSQGPMIEGFQKAKLYSYALLPRGAIVAVAELFACLPTDQFRTQTAGADSFTIISEIEAMLGDYTPGRFAWRLCSVRPLKQPYPFAGHQGFFEVPDEVATL